jgi:RNase H-fold protein (predicted Holliday junction resolvase)
VTRREELQEELAALTRALTVKHLVAIDPGVRACGVACFSGKQIAYATWMKGGPSEVAHRIVSLFEEYEKPYIVIETPIVVRGRAFRGQTKSLLQLSQAVGELTGALRVLDFTVDHVPVNVWKRNTPTEALHARLMLPGVLSPAEHAVIDWPAPSYRHNVTDAIALGRWY